LLILIIIIIFINICYTRFDCHAAVIILTHFWPSTVSNAIDTVVAPIFTLPRKRDDFAVKCCGFDTVNTGGGLQ